MAAFVLFGDLNASKALALSDPSSTNAVITSSVSAAAPSKAAQQLSHLVAAASTNSNFPPGSEPVGNRLSIPTWVIHISSIIEWVSAMVLITLPPLRATLAPLAWGMLPLLGSAMCAVTLHFFNNSPSYENVSLLQAALTCFGNCTLCYATYVIFKNTSALDESSASGPDSSS